MIDLNAQLRALFSPLARPAPSKLFLYDMAGHKVAEPYFSNFCLDTSTTNNWFAIYDEMYHAAYDTTPIALSDDVFDQAMQIGSDTITMGLMDYEYYTFKDTALKSNIYFNFDTINTVLTDKVSRPGYPFDEHNLFTAAPLWNSSKFLNVVFRIDPDYLFIDTFNLPYYSGAHALEFKIDFGDGNGYVVFDPTVVTYYNVSYHSADWYYIKAALFSPDDGSLLKYSVSTFKVTSNLNPENPDYDISIPGLNVSVYGPCDDMPADKFVIVLPGWDALEFIGPANTTIPQIYHDIVELSGLAQLQNFGYSFVVVDWADSRQDIRFNALSVIDLIKELKCRLVDMGSDEEIVIIGQSMGGLVARYALTYMESSYYDIEGDCAPEKRHNTRLMITLDTPHQGANVPLSMQKLYYEFVNWGPLLPKLSSVLFKQMDILLDGDAAKQMLILHVSTQTFNPFTPDSYSEHAKRTDFVDDLYSLGNYPQLCKKVALSNGSMEGEKLRRSYGSTPPTRYPGDYFLDLQADLYIRLVGFKIKIFAIDLKAHSNPDPNGDILNMDAGSWNPVIKLKLFGLKITLATGSMFILNEDAECKGYCVNAAGLLSVNNPTGSSSYDNGWGVTTQISPDVPDFFGITEKNNGNGYHAFDAHIGMPGFDAGASLSIYSDGFAMGFVPVQSALDYGTLNTPQPDITDAGVSTASKMASTPFDVIIGNVDALNGINEKNWSHLYIRNDRLIECETCSLNNIHNVFSYILNREIGDEDMYVDNLVLTWFAHFEAERNMYVDEFNPYYQYPSLSFPTSKTGMYSKENTLQILGSAFATFQYDPSSPKNGSFVYTSPATAEWTSTADVITPCCIDYTARKGKNVSHNSQFEKSVLTVFPNPSSGIAFTLLQDFKGSFLSFEIYNNLGGKIYEAKLINSQSSIQIANMLLKPGLYLLKLSDKNESRKTKLLVTY